MSLISLETPCRMISAAPIGIVSLTGQYWMPHSVNEISPFATASAAKRQPVQSSVIVKMKKNSELMMSAIALPRARELRIEDVDADVLVLAVGVGARDHVLHAEHQEHAFVHPVGRRIEDEARHHLVVVGEHREHGPVGDVLADLAVDARRSSR